MGCQTLGEGGGGGGCSLTADAVFTVRGGGGGGGGEEGCCGLIPDNRGSGEVSALCVMINYVRANRDNLNLLVM